MRKYNSDLKDDELFESMVGKVFIEITVCQDNARDFDHILFKVSDDEIYKMYHEQDCCEVVTIEDICGDIMALFNSPILKAEVRSSHEDVSSYQDSQTYTFYELATIQGSVTIRWFGASNGYYSESVDFVRIK